MIPGSALPLLLATTGGGINPRSYFDVKLYTGNGSTQTISGLGFSPDLVWIKSRSSVISHHIYDTVRGTGLRLQSDTTNAEATRVGVSAFNADGFDLGSDGGANTSAATYAAWTWDAGSSTVTNTDGSVTSQVRANPSAGFSIVTYTAPAANTFTVGHGLGVPPSLILVKGRNQTYNWDVYHQSLGATGRLILNTTGAFVTTSGPWANTSPTSSVFSSSGNGVYYSNGDTLVAYCFAPVAGYSAFGNYTGNGSAGGPIISGLGFTPYFVMIKASSTTGDWWMYDGARSTTNPRINKLKANSSNAEDTAGEDVDFQSDGFQVKTADIGLNQNAATYIYAAFA